MRIVIPDWDTVSIQDLSLERFSRYGNVICIPREDTRSVAEQIGSAEIVLCNKTPITAEVIAHCPRLRYIGLFATGYNNIDLQAASEHAVCVCNAGSYSTGAVVQHTFALLLTLLGNLRSYERDMQEGAWISSPTFSYFPHPMHELEGKTFAIIGYGSIGKKVAAVASAFGMQVVVATRSFPKECPYPLVSIEDAFTLADVLSIHCPLNASTENLVCKRTLSLMKPSAILLNTARGGIVVEQDLAVALYTGMIAAAGLDVLRHEPMQADTPLRGLPNCLITPHIAWSALETRERLLAIVEDNLRAYLEGKPQNKVN